ncbi:MAG TPA: PQQ-dependent sugar dehydrogenase, partial [Candidatus Krumholzibacteria bacterium]|nr:PQQ-dependent sugar dehydrogenase [Candidatus Krumholzibacteria bacterium]
NLADPATEVPILTVTQNGFFHKGGCIEFGADGYLYISLGEDGTPNNAQSLTTLKGKVLRIDVNNPSGGRQYGIPTGNPFKGNPNGYREEIWAFGFRNPWRFSCDEQTGQMWLGDVGQNAWEEVDFLRKGRNFGWPLMEGSVCYPQAGSCDTMDLDIVLPVATYPHGGSGASITGGCVYRGPTVPSLYGDYVFGDFITGQIWYLDPDNNPSSEQLIIDTTLNISAFGTDADGELYFSTFEGQIYRFFETTTDVGTRAPGIHALRAVRPNPFSTSTVFDIELGSEAKATLEVFDVRGRRVATLIDTMMPAGDHTVTWDGRDVDGRVQPSGVFFCRLTVSGSPAGVQRIVKLK